MDSMHWTASLLLISTLASFAQGDFGNDHVRLEINRTNMTDEERAILIKWVDQGATIQ